MNTKALFYKTDCSVLRATRKYYENHKEEILLKKKKEREAIRKLQEIYLRVGTQFTQKQIRDLHRGQNIVQYTLDVFGDDS